jgi:hypothetical protein
VQLSGDLAETGAAEESVEDGLAQLRSAQPVVGLEGL